ncbi:hypothetical protein RND81_06G104700 [Saponaria officinalis]|uniref:Retrotransposon Copia-like N-terminal domain-containing protein n=1 Tax=Saponaria officinalis TaxID=3572 RepID=A0AAW1KBE7_SAPOF
MSNDDIPPPLPKLEPNSPFYLGPQDRPGDFITLVRLRLDNFDDWSYAIRVSLLSRRKFGFLDGTISDPIPPCTKEDWTTIHCMLVSWIFNTITPEVRSMLSNYDNANILWDDLNERFSVVNRPRIQQLKADINRCVQTKTIQLRSTLLSQDRLPSLNRAFKEASQEERDRGITQLSHDEPAVVGFAVKPAPHVSPFSSNVKPNRQCSHCNKTRHDISTCFDIHGVVDWWSEKYGKKTNSKGRGKPAMGTSSSVGRGHTLVKAHATPLDSSIDDPVVPSLLTTPPPVFPALQWQSIVAAFGTPSNLNHLPGKLSTLPWIIDTGCSHHVTGDLASLLNARNVTACPVGLPDGKTVFATKEGVICLTENITLHNVLFVPHLPCNLISVSQLVDDLTCLI